MASAAKSFTTRSVSSPRASRNPAIEKRQWWFVMLTKSPSTGLAIAMAAWRMPSAARARAAARAR